LSRHALQSTTKLYRLPQISREHLFSEVEVRQCDVVTWTEWCLVSVEDGQEILELHGHPISGFAGAEIRDSRRDRPVGISPSMSEEE
jgi:hypothetical protein